MREPKCHRCVEFKDEIKQLRARLQAISARAKEGLELGDDGWEACDRIHDYRSALEDLK